MKRPTILVVDDEQRMRDLIRLYLQAEFTVIEAENGDAALSMIRTADPDLVVLDVMMPHLDGWSVLEHARAESAIPIVMLTARGDVPDRVRALRMGADDYMPKPFDGRELAARIHAVLRRTAGFADTDSVLRRGRLRIQIANRTAEYDGRAVSLTPTEFDLLALLASRPGQVFTRDRLLDRVWGPDYAGDVRTVDSHIKNLREKLGAIMIATVWGVGYKFVEAPDASS